MFQGILFALAACFIWGLIFVVPQFMTGFTSLEVALGRYFLYGVISCLIFLKAKFQGSCRYPLAIWTKAIYFSLITSIGYYTFVVLALRYATPAICALVLGISPITIAFYGNWKQKECTYKSLLLPSGLILIGLAIINAPHLMSSEAPSAFALGLACAFWALISWSWYVVANSEFLKSNPEVQSNDWATLLGVGTFFWVILFALILGLFFGSEVGLQKYYTPGPELTSFFIGSAILGLLCSWVGGYLWNKASLSLPVSLAGQLTLFETIFGVLFVYTLERQIPPLMECVGMCFLFAAILLGIRQFAQNQEISSH